MTDNEITLIFDLPVLGFYRYIKPRLRALGIRVVRPPCKDDPCIVKLATKHNAIIITTDSDFYHYAVIYGVKAIILPPSSSMRSQKGKPKRYLYAEWWKILITHPYIREYLQNIFKSLKEQSVSLPDEH